MATDEQIKSELEARNLRSHKSPRDDTQLEIKWLKLGWHDLWGRDIGERVGTFSMLSLPSKLLGWLSHY